MKIITRYILKEHVGPFVFALSALTSLLLLQYIARKFGDLVGRGLSWNVIAEFFLLSIPFTLAMTLPMAVLVAVLYAFSRLASENEITALKAGGVSSRALMRPALIASTFLAVFMLYFNDQLLPRANHELATLQMAILRTKPTFALRPQVINTIKESQLYLRAGQIDEATGLMQDVTIYDLSRADQRRTVYADSGTLAFASNRRDLSMHLFDGMMMTAQDGKPGQLNRVYFQRDAQTVKDVANQFQAINADTALKGDREMTVCEMQRGYQAASNSVQLAERDSALAVWRFETEHGSKAPEPHPPRALEKAGGIGALYCRFVDKYLTVQVAEAAEVPAFKQDTAKQDTTKRKPAAPKQKAAQVPDSIFVLVRGAYVKVSRTNIPDSAYYPGGIPAGKAAIAAAALAGTPVKQAPDTTTSADSKHIVTTTTATPGATPIPVKVQPTPDVASRLASSFELNDAKARLEDTRHRRNRYGIEIQKKFSLAASCIVFVLVGAPIALRFPRGGVGLVIGASFFVFAVYYVGLIGGESLANKNIISPFWAMWADNLIFLAVGLVLMMRMGNERVTSRGGNLGERMDATRQWFARQGRRVGLGRGARA